MEGKKLCGVVQDLLPLYQDDLCGEESRAMIEMHLQECELCRNIAKKTTNLDVENKLIGEKKNVLLNHARKERKRSMMIGIITACVLLVPVVVCLICNLVVGKALDWFYIVLSSLLLVASITVVPMIAEKNRALKTIGCFVVTLVLLLGVICLYTKGNWFFISVVPTLFGLSLIFLPYILYNVSLPVALKNQKGLIYMVIHTVFLFVLIWLCGRYSTSPLYNRVAYGATTVCVIFVWILFVIVRYLPLSSFVKGGIIAILSGAFAPFIDNYVDFLIYGKWGNSLKNADLFHWSLDSVDPNIHVILIAICVIISIVLFIMGFNKKQK